MINWVGLWTLTNREVGRCFSVYRQTVIPGLISSVLYIFYANSCDVSIFGGRYIPEPEILN